VTGSSDRTEYGTLTGRFWQCRSCAKSGLSSSPSWADMDLRRHWRNTHHKSSAPSYADTWRNTHRKEQT
jgi:hypothetical protein